MHQFWKTRNFRSFQLYIIFLFWKNNQNYRKYYKIFKNSTHVTFSSYNPHFISTETFLSSFLFYFQKVQNISWFFALLHRAPELRVRKNSTKSVFPSVASSANDKNNYNYTNENYFLGKEREACRIVGWIGEPCEFLKFLLKILESPEIYFCEIAFLCKFYFFGRLVTRSQYSREIETVLRAFSDVKTTFFITRSWCSFCSRFGRL